MPEDAGFADAHTDDEPRIGIRPGEEAIREQAPLEAVVTEAWRPESCEPRAERDDLLLVGAVSRPARIVLHHLREPPERYDAFEDRQGKRPGTHADREQPDLQPRHTRCGAFVTALSIASSNGGN